MSNISSTRNDDQCSGFEPQNWRRDRCKKCFRLKEQHTRSRSGSENIGSKIKKLIPSSSGSKSLDLGQSPDAPISKSSTDSSSWRQKFQIKDSGEQKCDRDESRAGDEVSVQKYKENGKTDKGEPEIPYTPKKIVVAAADDDENSKTPPPPTRKTRLVILKAEVSVDGNPVSDEISVETSIGSDSPSTRSPCPQTASATIATTTIRQRSPDTQSFKSFDGSVASSSEYLSARSAPIGSRSRTSSCESVASTLMLKNDGDDVADRVSLTGSDLLRSEGEEEEDDDERSLTPTAVQNGGVLRRKLRSLRAKLKTLERRCSDLTKENERYRKTSALISPSAPATQNLETLQKELVKSEVLCQNYQLENERLRDELSSAAATLKSPKRHSSTDLSSLQPGNKDNSSLREKLSAAEQLCEELLNENENLKADLKDMQQELEEMRDQYREEEIDEFRDLQRELEQTAKNCRILQFKLRKAERRNDQTEADRQHLQEKIREILNNNGTPLDAVVDSPRLRELESELRIAKEVSVRLHNELEAMDEKRCKLEDENFCFRERIRELEAREKIIDISRPKPEQQKKYNHDGSEVVSRLPPTSNSEAQLLRNLQDALERETDLRDQLKFAEQDIKIARKTVSDLETENECLMRQLSKISSTKSLSSAMTGDGSSSSQQKSQNDGDDQAKKGGKNAGRPMMKRSLSEGHAQIELELAEQEAQVLRSKLEKMERDKERLVSKISLLEKEAGKLGGRTQFSDDELRTMVPDTYYKQKIRMLEEEVEEWKIKFETMQKAEADQDSLDRSKFPKPVSTTTTAPQNAGSGANILKDADLKFKHDILEREVSILRQRLVSLELENERISNDNRRLMTKKNMPVKKVVTNGGADAQEPLSLGDKVLQMEAEIRRFLNRIADLEKEKEQLSKELERRKRLENIKRGRKSLSSDDNDVTCLELQDKVNELMKENDIIKSDFKNVQLKAGNNETQLAEYKQIIGMSDDEKLITMATKVEVLTNQLKEVQNRYDSFHKNMAVGRDLSNSNSEKYEDILKQKIESLEKELSEQKAKAEAPWRSDVRDYLCSQFAQLESMLRNSKLKDDAIPIAEKIKVFSDTLKSIDVENESKSVGGINRGSDSEVIIRQLRGQLDQSLLEKSNAIQECERATARLLQTEERWNKELEKLRESYENQMKDLKYYLEESEKIKEEKSCLLLERTASLNEKTKRLNECESKIQRLEQDLKQKHKDLQEKLDAEKKRAKEFETKYQKLESLYETDRQKLNSEKEKFKADLSEIRKRYEETQTDFEKLKTTYERKENLWASEKTEYEKRLSKLIDDAKEIEIKAAQRAQEMSSAENQKLLASLEKMKLSMDSENEKWSKEKQDSKCRLESTIKENESLSKEIERLKKELETTMSQIKDQKQQLEETRRVRDETKEEMQRWQQTWTKERAELAHKMRQEEKVQQAEQQALHLKYESKIKIIEDSNKRVQTQLTQVRREKDQFRENVLALEKTIAENGKKTENEQKELLQRISELELKAEKIDDLVLQLEKEKIENQALRKTYETDKKLWTMKSDIVSMKEKDLDSTDGETKNETAKLIEQSMALADELRRQIEDDKGIYDEELASLRKQFEISRNEWAKERKELSKKMKELQETIKVKEIDRLNLLSNQEQNEKDKTKFQNERDLLLQKLQETEIHQMANKYKLDKIYEQILDLASKCQQLPDTSSSSSSNENQTLLRKVLEQLVVVRDDLSKAKELNKSLAKMQTQSGVGRLLLPPSGADFSDATSIKSAPSMDKSDQNDRSDSPSTHFLTNRHYLSGKSPSVSSDIGPDGRFTGRLRSPSPNPRKITNYPEPPPSIIFNTGHCVEYDSEGRRHWTRKSFIQRSVSLDPAGGNSMADDQHGAKADENSRLKLMSAVATSTTNLSIGSQSPAYRRRMANIFATLRKSTSRERRKTQCPSVASSSDQLSEALQPKSDKSGYDRGRSKGFSGSRILDKIRGRSSSRGGQKAGLSRDPSLDDQNSQPSVAASSSDAATVVKNVEQTVEKSKNDGRAAPVPVTTTSTSKSDPAPTIGVKYTRSGSTHSSSSPLSYKTSSSVGTAKEYVTKGSRTASASSVLSKNPYVTSTGTIVTKSQSNFRSINPSYGSVRTLSAKFFNR